MPLERIIPIDPDTRAGIWLIREPESFFRSRVHFPINATHPQKRLQGLAVRYLLPELFEDIDPDRVYSGSAGNPSLKGAPYFISFSHTGDHAAAIASRKGKVGIDIEFLAPKVSRVAGKFLAPEELIFISRTDPVLHQTICWCAKEAIFKWHGEGGVDFKSHIRLYPFEAGKSPWIRAGFRMPGMETDLIVHYACGGGWCMAWCRDAAAE